MVFVGFQFYHSLNGEKMLKVLLNYEEEISWLNLVKLYIDDYTLCRSYVYCFHNIALVLFLF